jgi:hypothetical protein
LWRRYERWLEPLKSALGDVLERYPDVPTFQPPPSITGWTMRTRMRWSSTTRE